MPLAKDDCRGVWVPIVTPFRDEVLDVGPLAGLVERLVAAGIRGFLALGTTGEAPHLEEPEAEAVVRAVVRAAAGRVPVLAGSGRASTAATVEAGHRLAAAGAEGLLVLTPHAYRARMDAGALRRHYAVVASRAPVPLFVYHMPDITGLDLAPELLAELVQLPNVWGFKDSSSQGGPLAATLQQVRTCGLVGSGARLLEGLEAGAAGGVLAIGNAIPEVCVRIYTAWSAGDRARARSLQEGAAELVRALRGWGVAGIKTALAARGLDMGPPRLPLRVPPPDVDSRIVAAVRAALAIE